MTHWPPSSAADLTPLSREQAAAAFDRQRAPEEWLKDKARLAILFPQGFLVSASPAMLALFGAKGYGEILGILATPYLLLAAVAPAAFAVVVERYGYNAGEAILFVAGLLSFLGMEVMARWYRRRGRS